MCVSGGGVDGSLGVLYWRGICGGGGLASVDGVGRRVLNGLFFTGSLSRSS